MTEREHKVFMYISSRNFNEPFTEEAALLKETKTLLGMLGAVVVREESFIRGRSDLIICYKGKFIACELKDDIGTPSPHQIKFIKEVRNAEGIAGVCRTLYEVFVLVVEGKWTSEI